MTSVRIRGLPWFSRYLPYETHAAKSHSVPAIFRLLFGVALPWRRLHGQQNRNAGSSSNPIRTVGVKIESQFTRPFEGAITIGCARWKSSVAPWVRVPANIGSSSSDSAGHPSRQLDTWISHVPGRGDDQAVEVTALHGWQWRGASCLSFVRASTTMAWSMSSRLAAHSESRRAPASIAACTEAGERIMQSIFGKGSLYGVRATLRPDPDIMLGTSVDALAWLAKMGGPQASVTLLPTRKIQSAVCDWLAHISSGAGPMIPVGSPVAAPDEPAAGAAVADRLLRMRMRQAWFGQNGGDFLVLEGERVALLLADAQLVREYAADVHYAPPQGSANKTSRLGSCMRCTRPLVTCVRLATRLPDTLMCLTPTFAYSSRFQIRQGAAAGASGKSSRHKADRGIIKWRASTGPH
jgi:hypothetical protein